MSAAINEEDNGVSDLVEAMTEASGSHANNDPELQEDNSEATPMKRPPNDENDSTYNVLPRSPLDEKETPRKIVARSKEMLKLNMAIEVIKEEIQKFEEKAKDMEEDLHRRQQKLEEDAKRFDTFLQETDDKAAAAVKEAEKNTKIRLEKLRDLKQLKQQMQTAERDIVKRREALEDYSGFRAFLDGLTPTEWTDEQLSAKKERQQERRRRRIEKRKEAWRKEQKAKLQEEKEQEEAAALAKNGRSSRIASRRTKIKASGDAALNETTDSIHLPPAPEFEDEPLTDSDEDLPMYFERPCQLEDLLTRLEDETLDLMTSNQDADEYLSQLDRRLANGRERFDDKSRELDQSTLRLKKSIENEAAKAKMLEQQLQKFSVDDRARKDDELLQLLGKKVRQVYHICGFNVSDSSGTLVMLEQVEAEFDALLRDVARLPKSYLTQAEQVKEKKRREMKRLQKQAEQERLNEEKRKKALERAMEPPKKRQGKPIMYRSRLVSKDDTKVKKEPDADELDEIRHLN